MSMEHHFRGKWITTEEFAELEVRNVFHRQLEYVNLPCDEHRNRHILFRKKVDIVKDIGKANLYITADDYYKLYTLIAFSLAILLYTVCVILPSSSSAFFSATPHVSISLPVS